ncbi:MAG: AMP-binding protein, partial [Pseudomonadota bacterium]
MTAPLTVSAKGTRGWEAFAADVAAAQGAIAGPARVGNLAAGRYDFLVGLAAALLNGQTTVLPSSRAPEAVRVALEPLEDALILGERHGVDAPALANLPRGTEAPAGDLIARLAAAPGEIRVFTSGSTGLPVSHRKTWKSLAGGAILTDVVLREAGLTEPFAIIGTTPQQHMYGLEAAIFTGLAHGRCLYDGAVFYPDDLARAAAECRAAGIESLVLATSPLHLRYLAPAIRETPEIRLILSATAPMPDDLARAVEATAPVYEIYGSTETGSLGWRRTVEGPWWQVGLDFELTTRADGHYAAASHNAETVRLADRLNIAADGRFQLLGRLGDMVHVAGKRTSLGALNALVSGAPGLLDGVFHRRRGEGRGAGDDTLTLIAVPDPSTGMTPTALRTALQKHLRAHVDAVFLPHR